MTTKSISKLKKRTLKLVFFKQLISFIGLAPKGISSGRISKGEKKCLIHLVFASGLKCSIRPKTHIRIFRPSSQCLKAFCHFDKQYNDIVIRRYIL
jgi:hypothetical protein